MAAKKAGTHKSHTKSAWASGHKATSYDPSGPPALAPSAPIEQPRPAKSRYPISNEEYSSLKATTKSDVARGLKGATVTRDAKRTSLAKAAAPAVPTINVDGIASTSMKPPDCTCAVGPDHILISANASLAIHAKATGAAALQITLAQWFGTLGKGLMLFDPKTCYDQFEQRYILVVMGRDEATERSVFLISVSKSSDPLGGWFNHSLDANFEGAKRMPQWADYPGLGLDHRAIYLTANMFKWNDTFQYAKLRILDKVPLYAGKAPKFIDLMRLKDPDGGFAFTVTPCHTFGAPDDVSLVNSLYPSSTSPTQKAITLWTLSDPLGTPKLSAKSVAVAPYSLPPNARQSGGGTLDSSDIRIQNAVFRSGSVWTALTSAHAFGAGSPTAAIRWFQIEATTGKVSQQGVLGNASGDYYYPAIQPDGNNHVDVFFCQSSPTTFGSLAVSTRRPTDPSGSLRPSRQVVAGVSAYGGGRWGDYNGIACDPKTPGDAWCYGVYAGPGGNWSTRIAQV